MQLTQLLQQADTTGVQVLTVSVDKGEDSENLKRQLRQRGSPADDIIFLEDRGHRVINRYGLSNPRGFGGIPHPATYVIDKRGLVRWRFVETDYRVRASNNAILSALQSIR